jgi:hypothetical protein
MFNRKLPKRAYDGHTSISHRWLVLHTDAVAHRTYANGCQIRDFELAYLSLDDVAEKPIVLLRAFRVLQ